MQRVLCEFIACYKKNECLWNNKHPFYNDRSTKLKAFEKLKKILQKIDPDANKDTVTRKINSLRTNFNAEYKKMQIFLSADHDEVTHYAPKSPYFHSLMFLAGAEKKGPKTSGVSFVTMSPIRETPKFDHQNEEAFESPRNEMRFEGDSESSKYSGNMLSDTLKQEIIPGAGFESSTHTTRKRKRSDDDVSSNIFDDSLRPLDEHDAFGKYVAAQMRVLNHEQMIFLKRIINEGIFQAEMKLLSAKTKIAE